MWTMWLSCTTMRGHMWQSRPSQVPVISLGESRTPTFPVLFPTDIYVWSPQKKFLAGQKFTCKNEGKTAFRQWFRMQPKKFYQWEISNLVLRLDKCLNQYGEYMEKYRKIYLYLSACTSFWQIKN